MPLSILVTPGTPGYVADYKFDYDPKKAEALLAESGFSPSKPVKIEMASFTASFPESLSTPPRPAPRFRCCNR